MRAVDICATHLSLNMRSAAVVAFLLTLPLTAFAQLPPSPDAKAYPELAAMKQWLEAGSPQAQQCALSGGLFLDANALYRKSRSEERTVEAMMRANAPKLARADQERLAAIVANVTSLAAALVDLDAESAAIAFARMCVGRAQKPGIVPAPDTIRAQFDQALRCQRQFGEGSLDRKECVASAFRTP